MKTWSGFHKRGIFERIEILEEEFEGDVDGFANCVEKYLGFKKAGCEDSLNDSLDIANGMIENCIGLASLPLGIVPYYKINGIKLVVPLICEETSVIAGNCGAAKIIEENGGFKADYSGNNMIGQIQVLFSHLNHISNESFFIDNDIIAVLQKNESKYIKYCNEKYCNSMYKRGGGVEKIEYRIIKPKNINGLKRNWYIVIHVTIDVCDSMGANKVNTVCEHLAKDIKCDLNLHLSQLNNNVDSKNEIHFSIGLKILSNLCLERLAGGSFIIPLSKLSYKGIDGSTVGKNILNAYYFGLDDKYRAVTNNKGIMNGIDSVAIALGQDFRGIEAACHCYAAMKDNHIKYAPLADYEIRKILNNDKYEECLIGRMRLPIAVGTKGGAVTCYPFYNFMLSLLCGQGYPCTSESIAQCLVCVGLASNFAALRALATEGIQKGHMSLHASNIALSAGVPSHLCDKIIHQMRKENVKIDAGNVKKQYMLLQTETRGKKITLSKSILSVVVCLFVAIVINCVRMLATKCHCE